MDKSTILNLNLFSMNMHWRICWNLLVNIMNIILKGMNGWRKKVKFKGKQTDRNLCINTNNHALTGMSYYFNGIG